MQNYIFPLSQKELKDKMAQYPVPEDLTQCVTWDEMQAALISERQKIQEARPSLNTQREVNLVCPVAFRSL